MGFLSFLVNAFILLITWLVYCHYKTVFEVKYQGKPPIIQNSWTDFFKRRSLNITQLVKKGYEEYSKKGLPFRYYEGFGKPLYVIPPSHFASVRKQPSDVLNSTVGNEDNLILNPFLGPDNGDIIPLIRTNVTKSINSLLPTILSEIRTTLTLNFPSKPDAKHPLVKDEKTGLTWTPTNIHAATLPAMARVISRVVLGSKYADDAEFTKLISDFAHGIVLQAYLLRLLPTSVVKIIARYFNTAKRVGRVREYVHGDISALLRAKITPGTEDEGLLILPMLVKYVKSQPRYATYTEDQMVEEVLGRLLGLAFATIDTTTITITHVMHDLLSHPYAEYVDPIVQQANEILTTNGGKWNVKSLAELTRLDSFVKEVQRLRPVGYLLAKRMVISDGGVVLTSGAGPLEIQGYMGATQGREFHVPKGTSVIMPLWGIHGDPLVYWDPEVFKGFRFEHDNVASSQPTDRFMSFGHGRHACPGRHLALTITKLFVLEFLATHEYKEGQPRLPAWVFQTACVPDMEGRVLIRRKSEVGNGEY